MKFIDFIEDLKKELYNNPEYKLMDVEFCTLQSDQNTLLSIYEEDGKVIFDIGTKKDNDISNGQL